MKKNLIAVWSMVLLLLPMLILAQGRQVSGVITDDKGQPLVAASVMEKGTRNGTTTNEAGAYTLSVTSSRPVLVISFAGMQTREITVGAGDTYNVALSGSDESLSEVVVTALGIRRSERALGYSTQEVKGENLTLTKETNVLGSLAGKIAGVQVTGSSGANMGGT